MAGYKQFSSVRKTKPVNLHKIFKAKRNISEKKKTFFLTCDNTSLFGNFPSLRNSIFIFKHVYSLPGCLLHHPVQEILSINFHKNLSCQMLKVIFSLISGSNQNEVPINFRFRILSCVQWTSGFILAQAGVTFNTKTYFSGYNSYL